MKSVMVTLLLYLSLSECARILSFTPMPSKSHTGTVIPLLRELAKRGHQVTAITSFKMSDPPPTYREIVVPNYLEEMSKSFELKTPMRGMIVALMGGLMHKVGNFFQWKICEDPQVQRLIHSEEQFDLLIMETFFMQEAFSALQHKFRAPAVEFINAPGYAWSNYLLGNPYNPSYIPAMQTDASDHMSLLERYENMVNDMAAIAWGFASLPLHQHLMDSCFNYTGWESRPSLRSLLSDKAVVLQNSHPAITYPVPLSTNFVEVAGIHINPRKPLPESLQKFMDEATDGVILFSLGSVIKVSTVADGEKFEAFSKAFSRLKQKVLWKWETEMPKVPDNVMVAKWFPQQDILAHKNLKLFITHCGIMSITETVYFGVPIIGIPFFGDQVKNMRHVKTHGYGEELDFYNITEDYVYELITKVLDSPSYQEAVDVRSSLLRDNQNSGLDKAVFWTEYVLKHGGKHLRSSINNLYWWQSNLLDVFLVISLPLALAFYLSFICCRRICCSKRPTEEKKGSTTKSKKTN